MTDITMCQDFTSEFSHKVDLLLNVGTRDFETVMKHYDVSPEAVKEMVIMIRDWLKKQPHLPGDKLRDRQILGHLMFRGFSVEKVKRGIDDYFTARHRMPDLLCNRDPLEPTLEQYIKRGNWIMMPKKTPENYRVTFFRMNPSKEQADIVSMMAKVPFMYLEYRFFNEASLGDHWIMDLDNICLNLVVQMTPVMLSNIVSYVSICYGARLKSLHMINVPPFAAALVNLTKKMMKSKLAARLYVSTKEEVIKMLPQYCIPEEYGGEGGKCMDISDNWARTMQSDTWRKFFLEQNSALTDESKRLTPNHFNDIFGVDGSFRQITLD